MEETVAMLKNAMTSNLTILQWKQECFSKIKLIIFIIYYGRNCCYVKKCDDIKTYLMSLLMIMYRCACV